MQLPTGTWSLHFVPGESLGLRDVPAQIVGLGQLDDSNLMVSRLCVRNSGDRPIVAVSYAAVYRRTQAGQETVTRIVMAMSAIERLEAGETGVVAFPDYKMARMLECALGSAPILGSSEIGIAIAQVQYADGSVAPVEKHSPDSNWRPN